MNDRFLSVQATLKNSIVFSGLSLHKGTLCKVTLYPAAADHGIVFLKEGVRIAAKVDHVVSTEFCVTLGVGDVTIHTIEHLMCALLMNQISNVLGIIEGAEIPICDGSAQPFSQSIQACGIVPQLATRHIARVMQEVEVRVGSSYAKMSPLNDQRYSLILDYDHPALPKGLLKKSFSALCDDYLVAIDPARTYGFLKDKPFYDRQGLAQGASVETALIFDEEHLVNPEGFRIDNEVTAHKILDCIGDLSLLGGAFLGHYEAFRPGHGLNIAMVRALIAAEALQWEPVTTALSYAKSPLGLL